MPLDRRLYGSSKFTSQRSYPNKRAKANANVRPRTKRYDGKGRLNPDLGREIPSISDRLNRFLTDGQEREPTGEDAKELERTIEAAKEVLRRQHLEDKLNDGKGVRDDEESSLESVWRD